MTEFPGRLSIINSQSNLDNDLLLMAGIGDATQAIFAATQFLVKSRHLSSGQRIIVKGEHGTFGDVGIIVMTDARADPDHAFVLPVAAAASARSLSELVSSTAGTSASEEKRGSKKRAGKKSGEADGKARSGSKGSGSGTKSKRGSSAKGSSKKS